MRVSVHIGELRIDRDLLGDATSTSLGVGVEQALAQALAESASTLTSQHTGRRTTRLPADHERGDLATRIARSVAQAVVS